MARKIRRSKKKDPAAAEAMRASAARRGIERSRHFASGGTLASWRGIHTVSKNRRREKSRNACRGRHL